MNSLGFLLGRTFQKLLGRFSREMRVCNITAEQYGLLSVIQKNNGESQKKLADISGRAPTTITRALDSLSKKNLIVRKQSDEDRRIFRIYLTKEGSILMKTLDPIADSIYKSINEGFSEEELENIEILLSKLFDAI